jgi:hypothetical protein
MRQRFRLVWFIPDPYTDERIPLGSLVERPEGVAFVRADGASQLSLTRAQQALARFLTEELHRSPTFDALPASLGPHAVADAAEVVPVWRERRLVKALETAA